MASRARVATPPAPARRKTESASRKPAVSNRAAAPVVAAPIAEVPVLLPAVTPDAIAERAYYIWLRKGRPFGEDHQNWIDAEAELVAERAAEMG